MDTANSDIHRAIGRLEGRVAAIEVQNGRLLTSLASLGERLERIDQRLGGREGRDLGIASTVRWVWTIAAALVAGAVGWFSRSNSGG